MHFSTNSNSLWLTIFMIDGAYEVKKWEKYKHTVEPCYKQNHLICNISSVSGKKNLFLIRECA